MSRYTVNEAPVESLTPDQLSKEASELRHQLACVNADMSSKRAWLDADGKLDSAEYKTWKAKARFFWGKLTKRYSLVRDAERKLNRQTKASNRHVRRAEFDALAKAVQPNPPKETT